MAATNGKTNLILKIGKKLNYYRALCDRSFFHFVRIVGGHVHQGGVANEHIHGRLCRFTQDTRHNKRNAIGTPRDWLKSTIFTKWKGIWDYLQDTEERQLIAAENAKLASRMLKWIGKQFMTNEMLRLLYSDRLQYQHPDDDYGHTRIIDGYWSRTSTWSGEALELPRIGSWAEPAFTAIGIGGAAQSGHYTTIHIDDLVGEKAMESELVMEDVYRWFDNVDELLVNPDPENPEGSKVNVVGTHWGAGDFFCYVQEKYKDYKWNIVPALKDSSLKDTETVTWVQHPYQPDMETNWPGSPFTTQYYINMMNNPEKVMVFWAQHMNNPHKGKGLNKFEKTWLRFYRWDKRDAGLWLVCLDKDGKDAEVFKVSDIPLYGYIDPGGFRAEKGLKKGSRNAILVGGQPRGSVKKFVVHAESFVFDTPKDFLDRIFDAHKKWKPRAWQIDTAGQQRYIYNDVLEERKRRKVRLPISPIEEDKSRDSKDKDIEALLYPVSNGELYIHESFKHLVAEVVSWPHGMTKDLLDMLAKLYKVRWQRGEAASSEAINLNRQRFRTRQRDKKTGY